MPDGFGQPVGCILDQHDARAGEKPPRLDRINQRGRIFAQVGGGDPGQAHFALACGADQCGNHLGSAQGDAHGIFAINQQPGARRVGFAEHGGGVAAR